MPKTNKEPIYRKVFLREGQDFKDRKVQFVISSEKKDRHGTIIKLAGWELENYALNGIVPFQHNAHSSDPDQVTLGPGRAWIEGDLLIGECQFEEEDVNPTAEKVFKKICNGSLKCASIGMMWYSGHWGDPTNDEDEDAYYVTRQELLEFSVVGIPSNVDAQVRAGLKMERSFKGEKPTKDEANPPKPESNNINNLRARYARLNVKL